MIVRFKGGKELETALGQLANKAAMRRTATRALKLAAIPVRDEWERLAPQDQGDLKRSIKIGRAIKSAQKRGNSKDIVSTFIGIDEAVNKRLHIYAEVQEFGSVNHKAHPAGRPAWESKKQVALDRLGDDLWSEIQKTAQRAARKAAR